jgi:hypothetical protein
VQNRLERLAIFKNKRLPITMFSAAAFAAGCNEEQSTSQQLDKVQAETKQAAQDMKDYAYAPKSVSRASPSPAATW